MPHDGHDLGLEGLFRNKHVLLYIFDGLFLRPYLVRPQLSLIRFSQSLELTLEELFVKFYNFFAESACLAVMPDHVGLCKLLLEGGVWELLQELNFV